MSTRLNQRLRICEVAPEQLPRKLQALQAQIKQLAARYLVGAHGWQFSEVMTASQRIMSWVNQDLEATLTLNVREDWIVSSGRGSYRVRDLFINAYCRNVRKVETNIRQVEVTRRWQQMLTVFGGLLGVILTVALVFAWGDFLPIELLLGIILICSLVGGFSGHVIGRILTRERKRKNCPVAFENEVNYGVSKLDWERFISALPSLLEDSPLLENTDSA